MKKIHQRFLITVLCALAYVFLLALLYHDITYIKVLNKNLEPNPTDGLRILNEIGLTSKQVVKADTKPMTPLFHAAAGREKVKQTSATTTVSFSQDRDLLLRDLHQFSLYNPSFREHMKWPPYFTLSPKNPNLAEIWNLSITEDMPNWRKFHYQISKYFLYEDSSLVGALLHEIATARIVAVALHPGGTQLKFIIYFEDGGRALFKPMRFPRDAEPHRNTLYLNDYERHVSEIAAFHLDRILEFRRVPPVVGRRINIATELLPFIRDPELLDTFYHSPDGKNCFYGKCRLYCSKKHSICGQPDLIEGSFAAYLPPAPYELLAQRLVQNPWKRTYLPGIQAKWEKAPNYCSDVVKRMPLFNSTRRLYDVIDCAIFDFLIGNADRHDYDEFTVFGNDSSHTLIHLDNGRGFGRSNQDEQSIIAPLNQCCQVRLSTFNKLYEFYVGLRPLSDLIRENLLRDPVAPILTEKHLKALDRRVVILLRAIQRCIKKHSSYYVFLDDIKLQTFPKLRF